MDAAEEVFAELGPAGSTEEVARRAGVAVGTIFRHFPTKADLLTAIMKRLQANLITAAEELSGPDGLHRYFDIILQEAAEKRSVAALVELQLPEAVGQLRQTVGSLLKQAQDAGTVSRTIELPEVMALLVSLCQGALTGGWDEQLRKRTLNIVIAGLKP
nr:TetR/AcrR family transcriptional regulator [Actinoplanes sp. OR16]